MAKLIYGVGYNSKGKHKTKISGADTLVYRTWYNMLMRCYCPKGHARYLTYTGCTVASEWHDFQDFAEWFENHEYNNYGYELDKDLLAPNNKVYAPDRCAFVPQQLNKLLNGHGNARGQYLQGVRFYKQRNKFRASIRINGKPKCLGYHDTEQEAYRAYKMAKEIYVKRMALEWQDRIASDVFDALMQWSLDSK